jgi:hypothetical protein
MMDDDGLDNDPTHLALITNGVGPMTQGYFIEHNGDCWQSVFPAWQAELSQLHTTIEDALSYMITECGVRADITIIATED